MEDKTVKKTAQAEKESGGPYEKFIKAGSELKLNCYLRKATETPAYIFWYHNNTMVNYSPDQGRLVRTHREGRGSTLIVSTNMYSFMEIMRKSLNNTFLEEILDSLSYVHHIFYMKNINIS